MPDCICADVENSSLWVLKLLQTFIYIVSGKGNLGRFYLSLDHGQVRLAWLWWSIRWPDRSSPHADKGGLNAKGQTTSGISTILRLGRMWPTSSLQSCLPSASEKSFAAGPAPPITEKTKGVNVPTSTFKILSWYCRRFSISWVR